MLASSRGATRDLEIDHRLAERPGGDRLVHTAAQLGQIDAGDTDRIEAAAETRPVLALQPRPAAVDTKNLVNAVTEEETPIERGNRHALQRLDPTLIMCERRWHGSPRVRTRFGRRTGVFLPTRRVSEGRRCPSPDAQAGSMAPSLTHRIGEVAGVSDISIRLGGIMQQLVEMRLD